MDTCAFEVGINQTEAEENDIIEIFADLDSPLD
jgi:hypothetical protein